MSLRSQLRPKIFNDSRIKSTICHWPANLLLQHVTDEPVNQQPVTEEPACSHDLSLIGVLNQKPVADKCFEPKTCHWGEVISIQRLAAKQPWRNSSLSCWLLSLHCLRSEEHKEFLSTSIYWKTDVRWTVDNSFMSNTKSTSPHFSVSTDRYLFSVHGYFSRLDLAVR